MTENIRLLLKYEGKKKSYDTIMTIGVSIILFVILAVEATRTIPQINTMYQFINYTTFNIYQVFAIMLTTFAMVSVSSIRDIKEYRYLMSYPINYKELFGFIKIRKFKNFILTLIVNLIVVFYIGMKFSQSLKFFITFLLGFLIISILCYLISDITCFLLYSIFPSNLFAASSCVLLCTPIMIVINNVKAGNIINFYDTNRYYIDMFDMLFPYCKFIKVNLFSNFDFTYTILTIIISLASIILLSIIYEYLIKLTFFKMLEKEDGRKNYYSKTDIDKIRIQSSFTASFIKESKFLIRENKKYVFNIQLIIIISLITFLGIINKICFNLSGEKFQTIACINIMKKNYVLLVFVIYIVSLAVDMINFSLNSGRIALGYKYFSFDKYIQLNHKNTIYSIISLRLIISACYYFLFFILMYLYNLNTSTGIWTFIICTINIITVAVFDLIIDMKIPNLYSKVRFSYMFLDVAKTVVILIFKALNFVTFVLIAKYLIHNLYISLLIGNLIYFIPVIMLINSKYILNTYNRITYSE